jgi:hypothetical protein
MYELDNLFLINDEEEFIKNRDWESNWSAENIPDNSPIRSILTAKEQAKLFVRKTDGRVGEVSLKNELKNIDHIAEMKKSWAQVLNELWPRPSSGTSSKPPRYTKFKLSKNMMIYIEDAGWSRFKPQTVPPAQPITDEQAKAQTEALIQSFINKINDASNKAYTLELARTWPTQKNDYRRVSMLHESLGLNLVAEMHAFGIDVDQSFWTVQHLHPHGRLGRVHEKARRNWRPPNTEIRQATFG